MSLEATIPKEVAKAISANYFEITGFQVRLVEDILCIYYDYGNIDKITGEVIKQDNSVIKVKASVYGALFPDATKNFYSNIKNLLYKIGQNEGVFPAGTIV